MCPCKPLNRVPVEFRQKGVLYIHPSRKPFVYLRSQKPASLTKKKKNKNKENNETAGTVGKAAVVSK